MDPRDLKLNEIKEEPLTKDEIIKNHYNETQHEYEINLKRDIEIHRKNLEKHKSQM